MDPAGQRRYVVLEGNMGSGKSTALAALALAGFAVVPEPVDEWCTPVRHRGAELESPLKLFYRDGARYAFSFQVHVLTTRVRQLLAAAGDGDLVLERDPFDAGIFVEDAYRRGHVDEFEHRALEELADAARACLPLRRAGSVYLRVPPEQCAARIAARGREEEATVDLERLGFLHDLHEQKYAAPLHATAAVVDGRGPAAEVAAAVGAAVRSAFEAM